MTEVFNNPGAGSGLPLPVAESLFIGSNSVDWQSSGSEGFLLKPLFEDSESGMRTWLMKVEAGAWSPLHSHAELEQVYVLEGDFHDQDREYGPGDFVIRAPGVQHTAGSRNGAIMLLIYSSSG